MMVWSLFIIDLMGLFFYNKNGSIISIGDLPTTNIIEPKLIRKSPVPRDEEQGFLSFNYSSVPRKFFATRAARTPPTIGARMKIQTC